MILEGKDCVEYKLIVKNMLKLANLYLKKDQMLYLFNYIDVKKNKVYPFIRSTDTEDKIFSFHIYKSDETIVNMLNKMDFRPAMNMELKKIGFLKDYGLTSAVLITNIKEFVKNLNAVTELQIKNTKRSEIGYFHMDFPWEKIYKLNLLSIKEEDKLYKVIIIQNLIEMTKNEIEMMNKKISLSENYIYKGNVDIEINSLDILFKPKNMSLSLSETYSLIGIMKELTIQMDSSNQISITITKKEEI